MHCVLEWNSHWKIRDGQRVEVRTLAVLVLVLLLSRFGGGLFVREATVKPLEGSGSTESAGLGWFRGWLSERVLGERRRPGRRATEKQDREKQDRRC